MELGLFLEFPCNDDTKEKDAFGRSFTMVEEAEAMGVESVWLAEYHFHPASVLSAPITIASAIAARTHRMRIGLAVVLLPLGHPIRLAEEIATLDHISGGRLDFGIGRGTFPDTHDGYNSPFAESRGRFEEYLEIMLKAWTLDTFSFEGEYYTCQDLKVRPKPLQEPHPPVSVGVTSEETFQIVGRMGYPIIINPSRVFSLSELKPYIQQYRQAWQDMAHEGEPKVGLRIPVYVAETAEQAYSEPQESAMNSIRGLADRVAGSAARAGITGDWRAQSELISGMSYDDWLRDKVVFGTPDVVLERLGQLRDDLGLDQIMYEVNFGRLVPQDLQMKCLRLLTEKVLPDLA